MKKLRPPIVTVLGHVDHGKTTLLDAIRKTKVTSGEAGGITQSIGASVVKTPDGKKITFIDTPGHAAFAKMRSRGAKVADIAVLVIAADDGVMPQTKEAISYVKEAKIPFIVAITKTDLPSANPESVREQLGKEGIALEGSGGDVPVALVSAKKGIGIKELTELISLVAEVNEIKAGETSALNAVVIETGKVRAGLVVSVVVKDGTLKVGDELRASGLSAKARGLFNDQGKSVKKVGPGEPVLILGFSQLPEVGAKIVHQGEGAKQEVLVKKVGVKNAKEGEIPIVLKAQNQGALEAIVGGLPKGISLIATGIGDIIENDVFLAKASGARIMVFGGKVSPNVRKLANTEGVTIETFEVIYELFKRLEELLAEGKEKILGKAEIIKIFPTKDKKIAGCKMVDGLITKKSTLMLNRGENKLGVVRTVSLRKEKKEVEEVRKGEEFGIFFEPQVDFKVGDVLLSVAI